MIEHLPALYTLQQLDSAIDALKREYAALDAGRNEKTTFDEINTRYKTADSDVQTNTAEIHDLELEHKSIEKKRADYDTKLYSGKVTNPKELQAIQQEVEMLARQLTSLDEKRNGLLTDLETHRDTMKQLTVKRDEAAAAFRVVNDAAKLKASTFQEQAKELVAQRHAAVKGIPDPVLKRYDTMRGVKGGVAITPIIDRNTCGACRMALSLSIVTAVRDAKDIVLCDNCNRILIIPGAKTA